MNSELLLATVDMNNQIQVWDVESMVPRESRARVAAAVDHLSISVDGSRILAQSGVWLNQFSVAADGVRFEATRLMEAAPTAIAPQESGLEAYVLTQPSASMLRVVDVLLSEPYSEPIDEPLDRLISDIESRLSLVLDKWGDAQPVYRR